MSEFNPLLNELEVVKHSRASPPSAVQPVESITITYPSGITVTCSITITYPYTITIYAE